MSKKLLLTVIAAAAIFTAAAYSQSPKLDGVKAYTERLERENSISYTAYVNKVSYIPSQCYTKTKDEKGGIHNPCYSCHTRGTEPNFLNDAPLQLAYTFPVGGEKNPWNNLFVGREELAAGISDDEIISYVRTDNYMKDGKIILAKTLPSDWPGYRPDCYMNFDSEGFDINPSTKKITGWRAFRYYPFLGTFWPTNGSTDDVLIRLPESFMQLENGSFSLEIYKTNLAVIEAVVKQKNVPCEPIDETVSGLDLDGDGKLGTAKEILFRWAPNYDVFMYYAGMAGRLQREGKIHLSGGLYPEGTEFLHTVRYIGWDEKNSSASMARRMKEVRYARKIWWSDYQDLFNFAQAEGIEDFHNGVMLPETYLGNYFQGMENSMGWVLQGYIEDKNGNLRPQTNEETTFCMSCHAKLGATADAIFSFHRKLEGTDKNDNLYGWNHWTQKGLKNIPEPKQTYRKHGEQYEYSFYLKNNHAGDEFRENREVINKFFNADGSLKEDMLDALHKDITVLLLPGRERTMLLNKAYRAIVINQSFNEGRDASAAPAVNVHKALKEDQITEIKEMIY
jgi:hypothetical protein